MITKRSLLDKFSLDYKKKKFSDLNTEKDMIEMMEVAIDFLIETKLRNPAVIVTWLTELLQKPRTVQQMTRIISEGVFDSKLDTVRSIETDVVDNYIIAPNDKDYVFMNLRAREVVDMLKIGQNINVIKLGKALSNRGFKKIIKNGVAHYRIKTVINAKGNIAGADTNKEDKCSIIAAQMPFKKAFLMSVAEVGVYIGKEVSLDELDALEGVVTYKKKYYIDSIIDVKGQKQFIDVYLKKKCKQSKK